MSQRLSGNRLLEHGTVATLTVTNWYETFDSDKNRSTRGGTIFVRKQKYFHFKARAESTRNNKTTAVKRERTFSLSMTLDGWKSSRGFPFQVPDSFWFILVRTTTKKSSIFEPMNFVGINIWWNCQFPLFELRSSLRWLRHCHVEAEIAQVFSVPPLAFEVSQRALCGNNIQAVGSCCVGEVLFFCGLIYVSLVNNQQRKGKKNNKYRKSMKKTQTF